MKINPELRKFERYPTSFLVEIGDPNQRNKKKASTRVTNISQGGFCMESGQKMEVGSSLTFHLKVPLIVQGDVVYGQQKGKKFNYGVRFHNVRLEGGANFPRPRTMVRTNLIKIPVSK